MSYYIPKKLKIGFQQNRKDTLDGKLAYVIYYDDHGKLRKERSWNTWRHDEVEPLEVDNEPFEGLCLSKGHTRYYYNYYSRGGKSVNIRVFDPRGWEFEISPSCLVDLLAHTDCIRQDIQSKLVYAWSGSELCLLSVDSQEYKDAVKHQNLQGMKVSARDLVAGRTYLDKNQKEWVYLGRYPHFTYKYSYNNQPSLLQRKKFHVFYDGKNYLNCSSVPGKFCKCVDEECSEVFSDYIDLIESNRKYQELKDLQPVKFNPKYTFSDDVVDGRVRNPKYSYWQRGNLAQPEYLTKQKYGGKRQTAFIKEGEGYRLCYVFKDGHFRTNYFLHKDYYQGSSYSLMDNISDTWSRDSLYLESKQPKQDYYSLKYVFTNGKTQNVKT